MKICGIVAEYNPFHNGHAYHAAQTRAILGADTPLVAVMSGNYVQRGDFAMLDKYQRAAMAVQSGLDLVLELPLPAALSSAEGFARGAVATLDALGCVTHLSFGSECGDLDRIRQAARCVRAGLPDALRAGHSYAAALEQVVSAVDPNAGALLAQPNNTLGIEYCAALDACGSSIQPLTILRDGAAHDSEQAHMRPSASFVRASVLNGTLNQYEDTLPPPALTILQAALLSGAAPVHTAVCDHAILSYLRRLSPDDLLRFSGGSDGIQHRLYRAIQSQTNFPAICRAAQTRRYPLARVRRALLRAYLDLPANTSVYPQYVRVLAIGARGRSILRRLSTDLPVITKPVSEKRLPDELQPALRADVLADDLFALAQPNPDLRTGGSHYRRTPFCLPGSH